MRNLRRNTQPFYYALFQGREEVLEDGLHTGTYKDLYSEPVKAVASISPASGRVAFEQFGSVEKYDRIITTCDMSCSISESSILWVDTQDPSGPHDYVVSRVSRSLNSISYAITKVVVS